MIRIISSLVILHSTFGCVGAPITQTSSGQGVPKNSIELMREMGVGFNLGNTFDLKANPTEFADTKKIVDLYLTQKIRHVRIPVTWMSAYDGDHLADANGKIKPNHPRLKQLDQLIDYCLAKNLYVIINCHHEAWLKKEYDGPQDDARFKTLWSEIATRYAKKDPKLVFEVLNEPEGAFGDWTGPVKPYDKGAIEKTRHINQIGYDAIRATGGLNKTRLLMVMPNGQGNHFMLEANYPSINELPGKGKDPFLALSGHTYDPWEFCGQDGSNAKAPNLSDTAKAIEKVFAHARKLGVGLNYGEFGVGRNGREDERKAPIVAAYYQTVRKAVISEGGSVTPWDDKGWFGLVRKGSDGRYSFVNDLFPKMMHD